MSVATSLMEDQSARITPDVVVYRDWLDTWLPGAHAGTFRGKKIGHGRRFCGDALPDRTQGLRARCRHGRTVERAPALPAATGDYCGGNRSGSRDFRQGHDCCHRQPLNFSASDTFLQHNGCARRAAHLTAMEKHHDFSIRPRGHPLSGRGQPPRAILDLARLQSRACWLAPTRDVHSLRVRVCRSNRGSHWVQPCLNISFARCSICS